MVWLRIAALILCGLPVVAQAEVPALETAIRADDVAQIQTLLEEGASPDTTTASGAPVLVIASSQGSVEAVRLLLGAGARPGATTTGGLRSTALMHASGGDNAPIAQLLLDAGADVDVQDAMGDPAINWAAYYGNAAYVQVLLDAGADATLRGHGNAFEIALRRGSEEVIRITAAATGNLQTPSPFAEGVVTSLASGADQAAAAMILAQSELRTSASDRFGRPLLHVAALEDAGLTVDAIVKHGGDVDATDIIGFTALMHAARDGNLATSRLLVELGADVNHVSAPTGLALTPLHLAAIGGDQQVVALLIDAGAKLDMHGRDGGTALRWALYEGQKATANLLVRAGADVDLTSEGARSPRELAVLMGWEDLTALIESRDSR